MNRSFASLAGVYLGLFLCLASAGRALPETVLLELTNHWRYEQTSNLDGVNWMEEDFDDSAWPQGAGMLYYDSYPYLSPKGTQLAPGQITYYFRSHFTFPFTTDQAVLVFSNLIDDGAVFYLNGVEIQRLRMPGYPTPISYTNLATGQPSSGHALYFDGFVCGGDVLTNLRRGDNVLAVEVHQISAGSADIAFGSRLAVQLPPPVAQVQLALPSKVYEGSASNQGALYLSSAFTNDIPVQLISRSPELLLPGVVTIAAGATNVLFGFDVTDNAILEGPRAGGVWAVWQDTGFTSGPVTICDDEQVAISIELPASVLEGDTSKTGRIVFSQPPSMDVTVKLSSTNVNAVAVPATTVIPAGQTSAVFNLSIVDDPWVDGPEGTIITAEVAGWPPVSATITVQDNENTNLTVSLPASVREGDGLGLGAGVVRLSGKALTNLLVTLSSSDLSELLVPSSLVITAGQSSATFDLTMLDDELMDGTQPVTILAESAAYTGGSNITMVADNDVHHFTFDYISSPQYTGTPVTVRIVASDVNGLPIPVFSKTAELYAVCDGIPLVEFGTNLLLFSSGVWTGTVRFSSSNHLVRLVAAQIGGPEGESGPFDVELRPATILSLAGNDVVFSAGLNRLFVSVGPTDPVYPNRLVEVDPATKTIVGSYDLGPTPNRLAISANGQFIYCVTMSDTAVRLFSVTNRQPGYLITPPTDSRCVPAHVIDMATVVDNPNRIVMANRFSGCSWGEIRAFENGSPLSTAISQHTDPQSTDLESSLTPGLLYAIQDNALSRLGVSSLGVGIQAVTPTTIILPGTRFKARDNLIYSVAGHVIDPATFAQVGSYSDGSCELEVEPLVRRTFFVKSQAQPNSYSINVFDQLGFFPIDSLSITGVFNGPRKFIRYGTNGLAMVTASELVLIESPWLIPSLPATDLIISQQITPNPTNGGSNYLCTITVSNCGPNLASRVVVKDTLPSTCLLVSSNFSAGGGGAQNGILDWRIGNLAAGNSATATLIFVPVLDGYLTNGIIALSQTADTNFVNNVSTIIAQYPAANLSIAELLSPNSIVPGSDSACTFVVSNAGPNTAFQVQVLAQLSPQLTILSNSMGQGLLRQTGTGASWHVDSIPPGGTASLTFYLRATQSGWFDTRASVSSWSTDTNTADNTVSRALFVQANFNQGFVACIQSSTEDLMYDPWRGRIVASTGMNAAVSNSIVVVNPDTGLVESFMSLGQKPRRIACSDDGQFLYVSMPEIATVRRLDLGTLATEQEFSLGGEWIYDLWYPSYAADMAVAPGEPLSLAVWRVRRAGPMASEHGQGVALVENGVMRSNVTATGGGYSVEFDTETRILYAGDSSGRKLYRCAIDEGGVTFTNEVVLPTSVRAEVVYAAGRLFNTSARVLDPQSLRVTGIYPGSEKAILVSPDAVNHRIWFLTKTNSTHCWLSGYNMDNFDTLGTLLITNVSGVPGSLITCGPNRLSFRTSNGQLFLIRTDFAVPSVFTDLRLWQSGPAGSTAAGSNMVFTCTVSNAGLTVSLQPSLTNIFSAGCTVRSATSSYGTAQVVNGNVIWSAANLAPGTSILVTMTVRSSQEGLVTSTANLSSATPDTLMDNNTAVVTARVGNPPAQDSAAALLLPARNLIWWPEAGKILATVSGILNWSNSIVSIDPTTADVRYESFVGAGANEMAFSGDKSTLFVSMDYWVQMLDVPSMARSGRFVVDSGGEAMVPYDIAALPSTSNSLAVLRVNGGFNSDVVVFDGNIMRGNMGAMPSDGYTEVLQTAGDGSALYVQNHGVRGFLRYSVNAAGVTYVDANTSLNPMFSPVNLEWADGLIFTSVGAVIDPAVPSRVGTVPGITANSLVKYDSPSRRLFYLTPNGSTALLQAFDTNTLTALGSMTVTGLVGTASSLIRWGTDGLAFLTTGGQVFIIRTALTLPAPPADLSVWQAAVPESAVLTSNLSYTIIVTNQGPNTATNVVLVSSFSTNFAFGSIAVSQGTWTQSNSTLTVALGILPPGASAAVNVTGMPLLPPAVTNLLRVTSASADPNLDNNSTAQFVPVSYPPGTSILNLDIEEITYDPGTARIYASAGTNGNGIFVIDPLGPMIESNIPVGLNPTKLRLSTDNQYLYALLAAENQIARIDLASGQVDRPQIPANLVRDFSVVSGEPRTLVISAAGPSYGTYVVDDNGVRAQVATSREVLVASRSRPAFYGFSKAFSSPKYIYKLSVEQGGIVETGERQFYGSDAKWDYERLFCTDGTVYDAESLSQVGRLSERGLVEPDAAINRIFFLNTGTSGKWLLTAYDWTTFAALETNQLDFILGNPRQMIRWGTDGLAITTTGGQLFLKRGGIVRTTSSASTSDLAIRIEPPINPGVLNSNLVFQLWITNRGPDTATNLLVSDQLPGSCSLISAIATLGVFTNRSGIIEWRMPQLRPAQTANMEIIIRPGNPAGQVHNNASVTSACADPLLSNNIAQASWSIGLGLNTNTYGYVQLAAVNLVYEPLGRRLYASLANEGLSTATKIARIEPEQGIIEALLEVGSRPGKLAISDDGQYLYLALEGGTSIRRVDLPSFTAGPQFALGGTAKVQDMLVLPSRPLSLAVSKVDPSLYPRVGVYDDGVLRPVETGNIVAPTVLECSADGTQLFGFGTEGYRLWQFAVTSSGVTSLSSTNVFGSYKDDIEYAGGRLYSVSGRVVDPTNQTILGVLEAGPFNPGLTLIEPDLTSGRIFMLDCDSMSYLRAYSMSNLIMLDTPQVVGNTYYGATDFIRCGGDRFAFLYQNRIQFIRSPLVPAADLVLQSTLTTNLLLLDHTTDWTLSLSNTGPAAAQNVTVCFSASPNLSLKSVVPSAGIFSTNGSFFYWQLASCAPGSQALLSLSFTGMSLGWSTNTANVASATADPFFANNITVQALNVVCDGDGDQIPDDWEVANNFDSSSPDDAHQDCDKDGHSNLQEFLASTDPRDAASVLKLGSTRNETNSHIAELTFTAQPFKTYSVHYTEQLNPAVWHYYTNFPAASGIRVIRLPVGNAGEKRFYRIATPQMDVMPTVPQISVRTLPGGTNIAIRFDAVLNRSYEVQYTDRIGSTNWSSLTTYTAVPTNRVIEYVLPRTDSKGFFRVFSQTQ